MHCNNWWLYRRPRAITTPSTRIILFNRQYCWLISLQRSTDPIKRCCRAAVDIVIFTNGHKICQGLTECRRTRLFIPRPQSIHMGYMRLPVAVWVDRTIGGVGGVGRDVAVMVVILWFWLASTQLDLTEPERRVNSLLRKALFGSRRGANRNYANISPILMIPRTVLFSVG